MIKFIFSGLQFQDSDFKNSFYEEGFLKPASDFIVPISGTWNGETYPVQYLVYDSYDFELIVRDSVYKRFQKIQYAPKITTYIDSLPVDIMITDFNSEPYLNEFRKISLNIRVVNTKKVENIILYSVSDVLEIRTTTTTLSTINVNLTSFSGVTFDQVLIDNFSKRVSDYNKVSEFRNVRFYLSDENTIDMFNELDKVGLLSNEYIFFEGYSYNEYEVIQEVVGQGLNQITLILFTENRITVPNID